VFPLWCSHFGVPTCDKPWLHVLESVVQTNRAKILWDFDIHTDYHHIPTHHPEIVTVDNNSHSAALVDVTFLLTLTFLARRKNLCIELKKSWKLKSIKVIPIVIGCLESFSPNLFKHLKELPRKHSIAPLVKLLFSVLHIC